jgi:hypothetical protein
MRPDSPRRLDLLRTLLTATIVAGSAVGGVIQLGLGSDPRVKSAGPDGAGILPFAGSPSPRDVVINSPTPGQVINAQREAVAGTLVIVTHPVLGIVALTHTDENGLFVANLPNVANLELSLPDEALSGIAVSAGKPVLIIVP